MKSIISLRQHAPSTSLLWNILPIWSKKRSLYHLFHSSKEEKVELEQIHASLFFPMIALRLLVYIQLCLACLFPAKVR